MTTTQSYTVKHLLPVKYKRLGRPVAVDHQLAEAYKKIVLEYFEKHPETATTLGLTAQRLHDKSKLHTDKLFRFLSSETGSYLHMAYYIRGYGFSFLDLMRQAGVGETTWQNEDSHRLATCLQKIPSELRVGIVELMDSMLPEMIKAYQDTGNYNPARAISWLMSTYPPIKREINVSDAERFPVLCASQKAGGRQTFTIPFNEIVAFCQDTGFSLAWILGCANKEVGLCCDPDVEYICAGYSFLSEPNQALIRLLCEEVRKNNV